MTQDKELLEILNVINHMSEPPPLNKIWCGEGWYGIIIECHKKLKAIDPDYRILQIKEKFGSLRYYFASDSTDPESIQEMRNIAYKYEHLSKNISQNKTAVAAKSMGDIATRLYAAYENMGTASRDDLKEAADEITSLRKALLEAQRMSDTWFQRHVSE